MKKEKIFLLKAWTKKERWFIHAIISMAAFGETLFSYPFPIFIYLYFNKHDKKRNCFSTCTRYMCYKFSAL